MNKYSPVIQWLDEQIARFEAIASADDRERPLDMLRPEWAKRKSDARNIVSLASHYRESLLNGTVDLRGWIDEVTEFDEDYHFYGD